MNFVKNITSDLKSIPEIIHDLIDKIKTLPFSEGQVHDIKLSLEEALVNAMKHGNKFDPALLVTVQIGTDSRALVITVADQGQGFDFRSIPDPTKPDNLQKLSGRGVLLIRSHMDEVEYLDSGRKIKMTKFFKKGA